MTTAAELVTALRARGLTLATAESLTGGWLGAAITTVPGASAVYRGGIIAYATDLKHELLGVPTEQLARAGAVDPETAVSMARGVRSRARADLGVATTGVAGPAPQEGHQAGTVFLGLADAHGSWSRALRLSGGREDIRGATVLAAFAFVAEHLTAHRR